jgi:hypothetical protein
MLSRLFHRTLFAFVLFVCTIQSNAQGDRIYNIRVVEKGFGNSDGELYLKNDNTISATFSIQKGFPPVTYSLIKDESTERNVQIFTAECKNPKGHTLKWSGKIDGMNIQGKAQHFYVDKLAGEYLFSGSLKP